RSMSSDTSATTQTASNSSESRRPAASADPSLTTASSLPFDSSGRDKNGPPVGRWVAGEAILPVAPRVPACALRRKVRTDPRLAGPYPVSMRRALVYPSWGIGAGADAPAGGVPGGGGGPQLVRPSPPIGIRGPSSTWLPIAPSPTAFTRA